MGPDMVNHPDHYKTNSGLETIDVIEAFTDGLNGIEAVDTANIIKYICRWKKKNGLEDLKKAKWYLEHLISKKEND
jgi:tRNA (Thr-GGU) A37 N-methylase